MTEMTDERLVKAFPYTIPSGHTYHAPTDYESLSNRMTYVRRWEKRDKRRYWAWHTEAKHRVEWCLAPDAGNGGRIFTLLHHTYRCHRSRSGPRKRNRRG